LEVQSIVHAECAVLLDVRKDNRTVYPFYYIGVSTLSCLSCQLFFEAFNLSCPMKFYTRGCHGKVYSKWGDPCSLEWASEDEERKDAIRSRLNEELQRKLKISLMTVITRSRSGSDSTTASKTSDAFPEVSENQADRAEGMLCCILVLMLFTYAPALLKS